MKLCLLLLVNFIMWPNYARAACNNLRVNADNTTYSFNSGMSPALNLKVKRSSNGGCSWFMVVNNGTASSYSNRRLVNGANTIGLQIFTDAGNTKIWKDFPNVSSANDIIVGSFANGSGSNTQNIPYYPVLNAVTYERFGAYSDQISIKIYEGTYNGSNTLKDTEPVTLNYTMAKKVDLSLVDTGSPFNVSDTSQPMNFGTLTPGQQQSMDVMLKYNAGYNLKFSSLNNGNLKNTGNTNTVPYTMTVAGNPIGLAGSNATPVSVASGTGVSSTNGLRLAVVATIGSLGSASAGNYTDTITITVITTE